MKHSRFFTGIMAIMVVAAGCSMPPKQGSLEIGFSIWGFVGTTPSQPAAGLQVLLLDGKLENPIANKNTNFLGKFTFSQLPPGYYKVKVADKTLDVVITNENQRIDIDLSSESGSMNYMADAVKEAIGHGKPGGDTVLARQFAGKWYSFSGAAGGGGSESQMAFCPNGGYYENYEAGYSGGSSDQYGNEAMNWGNASTSGSNGSWSITGTIQEGTITINYSDGSNTVMQYQQSNDDPQCYYFDGRLHCYNGACD